MKVALKRFVPLVAVCLLATAALGSGLEQPGRTSTVTTGPVTFDDGVYHMGFFRSGNLVDVACRYRDPDGQEQVEIVLRRMRIIKVDYMSSPTKITVEATPLQAEALKRAQSWGALQPLHRCE
jgi:hypothetical protein